MAATFVTLACCLLALSSALTATFSTASSQTSEWDVNESGTTIPSSSTPHASPDLNLTANATGSPPTTTPDPPASAESTASLQTPTSVAPTTFAPSSVMTTTSVEVTTRTKPSTSGEPTTTVTQTPGGDNSSTSATTGNPASSSQPASAASLTTDAATKASRLHGPEKYITIVLSVTLGAVVVLLSICALCKRNRRQFAHRHLDECGDMREFVSDDDTLVISGGLYDAHPIYDHVPTPSNDQREYRLEFYC